MSITERDDIAELRVNIDLCGSLEPNVRALFNENDELRAACKQARELIEAWMDGPLLGNGVRWGSEDDHPPALKALRAALSTAVPR